ncbi:MAG: YraN family protein [Candidatus Omnitrophota bacterium]
MFSGREGEIAAARFLEENGYTILEHNYRVCGSEVDLIVQKGDTLCFVEVKTRGSDNYGLPEEFVDERKRKRIIRAAKIFSSKKEYENFFVRFDIIAVHYSGKTFHANHIRDAFEGPG